MVIYVGTIIITVANFVVTDIGTIITVANFVVIYVDALVAATITTNTYPRIYRTDRSWKRFSSTNASREKRIWRVCRRPISRKL